MKYLPWLPHVSACPPSCSGSGRRGTPRPLPRTRTSFRRFPRPGQHTHCLRTQKAKLCSHPVKTCKWSIDIIQNITDNKQTIHHRMKRINILLFFLSRKYTQAFGGSRMTFRSTFWNSCGRLSCGWQRGDERGRWGRRRGRWGRRVWRNGPGYDPIAKPQFRFGWNKTGSTTSFFR